VKIAKEELFDLQATCVPPRQSHKKGVSAGAAGEAGGFCIEEQPFFGILECGASATAHFFVASAAQEIERYRGRRSEFWRGKPIADGEVFAIFIATDATTEKQADGVGFVGKTQSRRARGRCGHGTQGRKASELIDGGSHTCGYAPSELAASSGLLLLRRSRIASAASLARGARSPAGPTQEGQPASQGQAWINSCVLRISSS